MKPCTSSRATIIRRTVAAVATAAQKFCPVIVVDDGSTETLRNYRPAPASVWENSGKGAALRAGFQRAIENGFTHAITWMRRPAFRPRICRNFSKPSGRSGSLHRRLCATSSRGLPETSPAFQWPFQFWFRVKTGVRLRDTQCGFRCYPLVVGGKPEK